MVAMPCSVAVPGRRETEEWIWGRGEVGEGLEGVEGEETVIGMQCIKE